MSAIDQIAEEKGISRDKIIETIEMAIAAAYKKDYGEKDQIIRAKLEPSSGKFAIYQVKIAVTEDMLKPEEEMAEEGAAEPVVEERKQSPREAAREFTKEGAPAEGEDEEDKKIRFNPERHMMLEDAKKIKKDIQPEEELVFPLETKDDFGRIAAQTAKQVIIQRIKEAERETIFDEYKSKEGTVVSSVIQRIEGKNIYFDLGKTVGIMFPSERVHFEHYRVGQRLKVFIYAVEQTSKGPNIYVSRSHPKLIAKLFEMEVPEISSGVVEIKSIARESGSRSKIAVVSNQEGVDPIGSCVGQKGMRITTIINELGGEKVDIIEWNDMPEKFISNSLSPARAMDIQLDKKEHIAKIIVPDDQLSLAIGKGGQNVRLAAKLTGWKIDVRSATAPEETVEAAEAVVEPLTEEAATEEPKTEPAEVEKEAPKKETKEKKTKAVKTKTTKEKTTKKTKTKKSEEK
jgi:N utilization substance protein A